MVNNVRKSSTNQDVEDEIKLQSQLLNSLQEKVAEMEEVSTRRVNIYCTCTKIRIAIVGQSFWCQMGTKQYYSVRSKYYPYTLRNKEVKMLAEITQLCIRLEHENTHRFLKYIRLFM